MTYTGACCDSRPDYRLTAKKWFAVFTTPRHEKRIEEHFQLRQIESFLPLLQKKRQWRDGSKGMLQLPLFPNYIFARLEYGERVRVLEVPGVLSIVGRGREGSAVPDRYIHSLRGALQQGIIEPHPYLTAGTKVRIRSGPMEGMEGVLLRKKNSVHVVITIEMIMRCVMVELRVDEIEPIGRICCDQPALLLDAS